MPKPNRRTFLTGTAISLSGVVSTAACDVLSTNPKADAEKAGRSASGDPGSLTNEKEAPQLAKLVKQGKIPSLAKRIPDEPVTLDPVEGVGQYGDVYNNVWGDSASIIRQVGNECLLRWKPGMKNFSSEDLIPNVAKGYQVRNQGKEYVFTLRKGMKWSDGEPFTADDIVFWWNEIVMNDEITPVKPDWLTPDNTVGTVTSSDPHHVVFQFRKSNLSFPLWLAGWLGIDMCNAPAHYLKQFHVKYNKNVEKDAKRAGYEAWTDLFANHFSVWVGGVKNKPTLNAWVVKKPHGGSAGNVVLERNPYYWKVDSGGSQLPYMDRVVFATIESPSTRQLKAMHGDFDVYFGGADNSGPPLSAKPVFARSRDKGGYHFIDLVPSFSNKAALFLNLSCKDRTKREVFLKKDFRIGLSHAINRKEILEVVYQRQGEPYQDAPRPGSKFYDREFAEQYTEYDTALANEHLDKVLPNKDGSGRRLGPDGKPFHFTTMDAEERGNEWGDVLQLMKVYLKAVGVGMMTQTVSLDLATTRRGNNDYEAQIRKTGNGLDVTLIDGGSFGSKSAGWDLWFQEEASGAKHTDLAVEPSAEMKKQYAIFKEYSAAYEPEEREALLKEFLQVAKEQFWGIGVQLVPVGYGVVRNDFRNVPKQMLASWNYPNPAPTDPCQFCRR